jgi:hypothetical protein
LGYDWASEAIAFAMIEKVPALTEVMMPRSTNIVDVSVDIVEL